VVISSVWLFVLLYLRFLFSLPRKTAYQFVVSGADSVTRAIGFEMLGRIFYGVFGIYGGLTAIEKTLENLCAGFLSYFYSQMQNQHQ